MIFVTLERGHSNLKPTDSEEMYQVKDWLRREKRQISGLILRHSPMHRVKQGNCRIVAVTVSKGRSVTSTSLSDYQPI